MNHATPLFVYVGDIAEVSFPDLEDCLLRAQRDSIISGGMHAYLGKCVRMSASLVSRMIRAIKLDVSLYEEVEKDEDALHQAIAVVAISRICSGLGSFIRSLFIRGISFGFAGGLVSSLLDGLAGVILALVGWSLWSFLTYVVGTRFFGTSDTQADYGELLRAIGFSSSPGVLNLLSFLPFMSLLTGLWELAAMVIAVRQALDFETIKSVLTCSVGWIAYAVALTLVDILIALPFFQ